MMLILVYSMMCFVNVVFHRPTTTKKLKSSKRNQGLIAFLLLLRFLSFVGRKCDFVFMALPLLAISVLEDTQVVLSVQKFPVSLSSD